ncbi:hypothetical protein BJX65DRAFT_294470 [Aspergillus insuetus]
MAPPPPKPQSSSGSARSSISSGSSLELPLGSPAPAPRRTDQGQGGGGFLFVDSQADTAENHALKKEKQAFALNKYFRRRREAAIERVKPSKPLPSTRRRVEQQSQSHNQAAGDEENNEDRDFQQHDFNDFDAIVQYTQAQSLTTYLSQGHTDPFASVALEMTNPRYSYFYHFRTHTIPACYPLDATRISTYWWRQAITQPALLQALMFLAAGHQASLQLTNNAHGRNSQETAFRALKDSLRSRGDSLKLLQDIIRDPGWAVAESTGLAIATLVTIEAVNANFAAVEAHAKGLRRVFDLFGGLERADHMFLSKIYLSDVKAAALTNTRPSYPIFPKWRNAILQHAKLYQFETSGAQGQQPTHELKLMTPRQLCTLGTSIFKAPWYPGLDSSMKTFLKVFLRLLVYYESAVLTPEFVMDTDNDLYILFEHQLLDTRYTTADRVITTAEDEPEMSLLSVTARNSPLNEPLRLTLLTFLTTRMWHLQPFPAMEYTTRYLKEALCATLFDAETDRDRDAEITLTTDTNSNTSTNRNTVLQYLTTTAPDLLFWILFVGGMASQSYTSYPWFVDNLAVSVRSLRLWEWEEARKVMGGFFWCDQAGLKRAEEVLWRDILGKAASIEWEGDSNDNGT